MDFHLDPFAVNKKYFDNQLSEFVYYSKYSRYREDLGRRETWSETVDRVVDYLRWLSDDKLENDDYVRIKHYILNMKVMPSMRLMAMAGKAAKAHPISIYNCSGTPMDSLKAFSEIMYLSMNGVGVGFSVEKMFIDKLPAVSRQTTQPRGLFKLQIADTTEGWCNAFNTGINTWVNGFDIKFDFSKIRKAGSPLKTKGGTASGPQSLVDLLRLTREAILAKQGERLSSVDVYDIVCKTFDCVISGGVRRSAGLCMFDNDDTEMLNAKNGDYWNYAPWRSNANNSVVFTGRLSREDVDEYFERMHDGLNGEPGFFSRYAAVKTMPLRRDKEHMFMINPCGESILRSGSNGGGLCNLTSVVARPYDTLSTLADKAEIASIIGTIQSMATDFLYLRSGWKENAEEERLLGVDITGHFDCKEVRDWGTLITLRSVVVRTNRKYADILGINRSAATTVVKPSGNSGVLLNVSSGVHPRWSKYYKRNVRVNTDSPLFQVLKSSGIEMIKESNKTYVVGFAVRSPAGSITKDMVTAMEHLEYWKTVKLNYTEHSVSMTCYYDANEIEAIKTWIYDNQDIATGLTFLPRSDAVYENAPYIDITDDQYRKLVLNEPVIDFGLLGSLEKTDRTESSREMACSAGQCDLQM